ncbi:MAG: sugar kinase [Anaerolineae bacterium]|nr:sugar kinase [Anaerolineae bacterium]
MTYDVITLGETMLRFSPPHDLRIEQATSYEAHIGGSESNVAVGLARLGLRVAWVSRMTQNALGHSIVNAIRAQGVDTSHVTWTDEDRVGLYFYEDGKAPRGGRVIYDRAGSAISKMQPTDLHPDLLRPDAAHLLHLSGITLAIGESAAQTCYALAQHARENGWRLSFDINYRKLLWSEEAARDGCHELASLADLLFLPLRDAIHIYGTSNDAEIAVREMSERYPSATIVMTLSADGAIAKQGDSILRQEAYPAQAVGRIGGGDAFVAGYLYGHINELSPEDSLRWGAACAAYKYSMPGDIPLLDLESIRELVMNQQGQKLLR